MNCKTVDQLHTVFQNLLADQATPSLFSTTGGSVAGIEVTDDGTGDDGDDEEADFSLADPTALLGLSEEQNRQVRVTRNVRTGNSRAHVNPISYMGNQWRSHGGGGGL